MRKLLAFCCLIVISQQSIAQFNVSSLPADRPNILFERWTNNNCHECADEEEMLQIIKTKYNDGFFGYNIHVENDTTHNPQTDEYIGGIGTDWRPLFSIHQAQFIGSAAFNRRKIPDVDMTSATATIPILGTTFPEPNKNLSWYLRAVDSLVQNTPKPYANIWAKATFDVESRVMGINLEVYYTSTPGADQTVHIVFAQDSIYSRQLGMEDSLNFWHMNVFRNSLFGAYGQPIKDRIPSSDIIQAGYFYKDSFTYQVPESVNGIEYDLEQMKIFAFLTEDSVPIINSTQISINKKAPDQLNARLFQTDLNFCQGDAETSIGLENYGNENIGVVDINYRINRARFSERFTGLISPLERKIFQLPLQSYDTSVYPIVFEAYISQINVSGKDEVVSDDTLLVQIDRSKKIWADFFLEVKLDGFGHQNSWEIRDEDNVLYEVSPKYFSDTSQVIIDTIKLRSERCYRLIVNDFRGNGMKGGINFNKIFPAGYLKLFSNGKEVLNITDFGNQYIFPFVIDPISLGVKNELVSKKDLFVVQSVNGREVMIDLDQTEIISPTRIEIINILGQSINDIPIIDNQSEINIDLRDVNSGVYFISIENKTGEKLSKKIFIP